MEDSANPLVMTGSQSEASETEPDHSDLIPRETLESDEELKMHLLGMNSYFTQSRA